MNRKALTYRFVFNRTKKLRKDGTALIQLQVYDPNTKKKRYFSTGIYILPEEWDDKTKTIVNHPNTNELNIKLIQIKQEFIAFEYEQRKKYNFFSLDMFDEFKMTSRTYNKFWNKFEEYIKNHNVSKSRKQYIRRSMNILKSFRQNIGFYNFDLKTIMGFDYYLRGLHYHPNTIAHFHKAIKAFLNQMVKQGVIDKNPYIGFKIKTEKTMRDFLTMDEVNAIEKLDTADNEQLNTVKNIFLFSCYTGLRFSDILNLKPTNFDITQDGVYMMIKQKKTKEVLRMPLHLLFDGRPISILKQYYKSDEQFIFPRMSNQYVNRLLKVIQILTNIRKTLTFHVARHTFGTLLAVHTKDPYLIKQLMGHSDIQTSLTYIHLSNKLIEDKLKEIKW